MKHSFALLGLGAAAVLGFTVWMGRSTSEPAKVVVEHVPIAVEAAAPPPTTPRARVTPPPSLPRRGNAAPAMPGLAADLRSPDAKIRRAAVNEVAASSDADAQTLLVASRDSDRGIAATAILALGKLYADGQVSAADMLARAKDPSGGPRLHSMAINAVGTVPHPDTARLLGELLASSNVPERRAASALLANQDPTDAIPLLIRALTDSDPYVRDNAVNGLRARSRGRDFGTDAGAWQTWWQSQRG